MMAYAHLDLAAAELGLLYMGGPLGFYDQPHEAQVESLAVALVRQDHPELSIAPATTNALFTVWNDIHAPAAGSGPPSTADALMAKLERE